ncbi:Ubiquitin carboxyl-terminal hydrolase 26 [Aphelenchoides besseyi]|nr:Ubiquitin carboxyl-terminal hydrolase 26 [Aphelenchoides besseyi]KAI6219669.1 Ubiquitin carboxyl-terminal hydrolase 26 [Aphelenchoides besseyi]
MNRHRGFENLGNTCYLSSIVMAISSSSSLSDHLQNLVKECKKSKMPSEQLILRFKFIDQLSKVIQVVRSTHIAPSASLLHQLTGRIDPNFRNRYPQDAHEFLGIITGVIEQIYDAMDKQKNRLTADDRSFRKFPMFFEIKNCVTCKRCGTRSYSRESQVGLNVDMNGHGEASWSFWNSWRLIERMSGSEQFFCGKCNRKVDATRTTRPISLPTVLVVRYYLFRVKFTKDRLSVSKVFPVRFPPLRIPLSEVPSYQKEMQGFYTLKAMVVHRGTQINDGHYISFVRSEHSKWRLFNDERTCEMSLQELQNSTNSSSTPYLLFYEKSN